MAVLTNKNQTTPPTPPSGYVTIFTDSADKLTKQIDDAGVVTPLAAGDTAITELTGDVTAGPGSGSEVATIANDAVTYAKMQNVSTTDRLLGRSSPGAGDVEEIPLTAAGRALIDDADAAAQRATLGSTTVGDAVFVAASASAARTALALGTIATEPETSYALLSGRSGGQSLNGGTGSSQNLTLDSTANATKGFINLQPTSGFVGIGTATPAAKLQVTGGHSGPPVASQGTTVFIDNQTYTDTSTTGTLSSFVASSFGVSTLAASNPAVTTSAASNVLIRGPVVAGTNETLTNSHGLYVITQNVGAGVTNSYGMSVEAASGGTNNYCAAFTGGNVGIGTTSPSSLLSINDSNSSTAYYDLLGITQNGGNVLKFRSYLSSGNNFYSDILGGGGNYLRIFGNATGSAGVGRIDLYASQIFANGGFYPQGVLTLTRSGDATSTATQKNSYTLSFQSSLWNGAAATFRQASIRQEASTTVNLASRLAFLIHQGVTSSTEIERMSILQDGNVGIGTATPSTKLHVAGPVRVQSYTVAGVPSASTSGAGSIIYVSNETGGAVLAFSDGTDWLRVTDRAIIS